MNEFFNTDTIARLEDPEMHEFEDLLTQMIFTFLNDDINEGDLVKLSINGEKTWKWDGDRLREHEF